MCATPALRPDLKRSLTSMLEALIDACGRAADHMGATPTIETVSEGALIISPHITALTVSEGELPWGRFLLHHDPRDRFNIQLDVFSRGYTGGIHAHGTWGAFWLLRGQLKVWDYHEVNGPPTLARFGLAGPGGFACFCPPISDWHKVGVPEGGDQTVSVHIYGRGYDMDTGLALGEDGRPRTYTRGAWGDRAQVLPALRPREGGRA